VLVAEFFQKIGFLATKEIRFFQKIGFLATKEIRFFQKIGFLATGAILSLIYNRKFT
jgi:N-acetylglutamate synthase-like GNAT family acetyltransferase